MSDPTPSWFHDPALLTAEVQRARAPGRPAPAIAGYEGLREIARGGQGIVYRGMQRSTRRLVAVKVLSDLAPTSAAARRRFEREIDLVAGLKHPGIVAVYDSGVTDDGRLYLVMEHIDGVPLDEAAGADPMSGSGLAPVRRVLELFATVCDAVQYAHQRGVIHRDLKPSNVRVDSAGVPHVLDFGLAKATGTDAAMTVVPSAPANTVLSTTGSFLGSLPWASPEQASGDPGAVDTRSDVYSLGVILYQLLTGRFPYDVSGGLRPTLDNILNAAPASPAEARAEIDDEVATIVGRALAKEPDRRYQSAGDLARDVRLYLAGQPIEAKRDSTWYTVRKQLRRYRVAAGAAAAFVVLVCAGLGVSLVLYRDASQQRDEAKRQADKASAVNAFLLETLGAADPDKLGPKTPIVELLDGAAEKVDARFAHNDDVRESLHSTLRETYARLGEFAKAEVHARKVVEIRRATRAEEDPLMLGALGDLYAMVSKQQRQAEVEQDLRDLLEAQRRTLGPAHENTLSTLVTLAQGLLASNRTKEASDLYGEALPLAEKELGPEHDSTIKLRGNLASAYEDLGRLDESEALYRAALEQRRRLSGPRHSETLIVMNNLGTLLIRRGKLTEAEPLFRDLLADHEERLGPDNPSTLTAMSNYSKLLQDLKRLDEAEPLMTRALDGRIRVLGEDHPHTLVTMNNVAALYAAQKKFEDSERVHRRCLALRTARFGPEYLDTIISMNNLGGTLREMGRFEEALPLFEKFVDVTDRTLDKGHYINAMFRMNLGLTLFKMTRYPEAEPAYLRALEDLKGAFGPGHAQVRLCTKNLINLYDAWGKPEQAAEMRLALPEEPSGGR